MSARAVLGHLPTLQRSDDEVDCHGQNRSGPLWQSDDVHFALVPFDEGPLPVALPDDCTGVLMPRIGRTLLEKSLAEFNVVLG